MPDNAADLATIRDNYIAALKTDSTSPKPSYSWEGRSVSRGEWRKELIENVKQISELINALDPFDIPVEYY